MSLWDHEKNAEEGIYPENIKSGSDVKTWWKCENGHSWQTMTKHLTRGRRCPYCVNYKIKPGENDFKTLAPPKLLEQWNYDKNSIKPNQIALRYSKPVWWKCEKGHEWKRSPDSRFKHTPFTQCPYCAGQYVIKGETDLRTKFPEILEDFNYERNRKTPDEIHWGTPKKVWWKCGVVNRTKIGTGCPRCNGKIR